MIGTNRHSDRPVRRFHSRAWMRSPMRCRHRAIVGVAVFTAMASAIACGTAVAEQPRPIRGLLVRPERVTDAFLASWKTQGATAIVVTLDETTKRDWGAVADKAQRAGLALWAWVEVARDPAMADAHPDWMASIGAHHEDWRRRFPDAPRARPGLEVVKAWPWVPIGPVPAFDAHRKKIETLLDGLPPGPGPWAGVFLNDLQAGPSSCGCGNDQCRWALDYGNPHTTELAPDASDGAAARLISGLAARYPGKTVVPVWVTECEPIDLPDANHGTRLCGGVACANGDCWPRYARQWGPLVKAVGEDGPIAVALWSTSFGRDPATWPQTALALFQAPPRGGAPLSAERTIAVIQAWDHEVSRFNEHVNHVKPFGCVLALDPIDQSWSPRVVSVPVP
jgi:hypothetical protein